MEFALSPVTINKNALEVSIREQLKRIPDVLWPFTVLEEGPPPDVNYTSDAEPIEGYDYMRVVVHLTEDQLNRWNLMRQGLDMTEMVNLPSFWRLKKE